MITTTTQRTPHLVMPAFTQSWPAANGATAVVATAYVAPRYAVKDVAVPVVAIATKAQRTAVVSPASSPPV